MIKIIKNTINIILVAAVAVMLISGLFFISGCKSENISVDETTAPQDSEGAEETAEVEEPAGDDSGTKPDEDSSGTEDEQTETEQDPEVEEEETKEIPVKITEEIEEADNYFDEGMYAEAAQAYRNAVRTIESSELSQELKDELLAGMGQNHQDAENITETARMHHSNAMNLQYEKRFEEAKAELEAALEIYPGYQTAIDALDSLEALMGLE